MRNLDEMTITQAVLANNSAIGDTRLCEIMTSLVQTCTPLPAIPN